MFSRREMKRKAKQGGPGWEFFGLLVLLVIGVAI